MKTHTLSIFAIPFLVLVLKVGAQPLCLEQSTFTITANANPVQHPSPLESP